MSNGSEHIPETPTHAVDIAEMKRVYTRGYEESFGLNPLGMAEALMWSDKPKRGGLRDRIRKLRRRAPAPEKPSCVYCEGLTPNQITVRLLMDGGYHVCRDHYDRIEKNR